MNRFGRVALLCLLVAASGCGGSSEDDVERAVHDELERAMDDDDASGREVRRVSCRDEQPICVARVRTRTGERFTGVKFDRSGDDVSLLARVDQGEVRPGPPEEGLERDLPELLGGGEVVDVTCDRDRSQCRARVRDGDQERLVGVMVALDDSDDYSIVTTFEQ